MQHNIRVHLFCILYMQDLCSSNQRMNLLPRMRWYCVPKNGADSKCSQEVLQLWKNDRVSTTNTACIISKLYWLYSAKVVHSRKEWIIRIPINTVLWGAKLRAALLKCDGDWNQVEVTVKRWSSKVKAETKQGSWITKHQLKEVHKWSKTGTQSCCSFDDQVGRHVHVLLCVLCFVITIAMFDYRHASQAT